MSCLSLSFACHVSVLQLYQTVLVVVASLLMLINGLTMSMSSVLLHLHNFRIIWRAVYAIFVKLFKYNTVISSLFKSVILLKITVFIRPTLLSIRTDGNCARQLQNGPIVHSYLTDDNEKLYTLLLCCLFSFRLLVSELADSAAPKIYHMLGVGT